jgi:hypothetical protein
MKTIDKRTSSGRRIVRHYDGLDWTLSTAGAWYAEFNGSRFELSRTPDGWQLTGPAVNKHMGRTLKDAAASAFWIVTAA